MKNIFFYQKPLSFFSIAFFLVLFLVILFPFITLALTPEEEAQLRSELREVEAQIAAQERILNSERQRASSLERDVAVLSAEIQRARLNIQARTINIRQLGQDISERTETIEELEKKIEEGRIHLSHLLRLSYNTSSYSLIEAVLSNKSLSEFFVDVTNFKVLQRSVGQTLDDVRSAREAQSEQRDALSTQQDQELNARMMIEAEKQTIERKEAEQKRLLSLSEQQAVQYEVVLREREQRASEIRNRLFTLVDSADIPFEQALAFAERAQRATGVRPAFLLGVFQQESGMRQDGTFGVNVGTCNRPGDDRTWRDIMPGPNDNSWRDDQTIYVRLMNELGLSPDGQPLSCPQQAGWGGAMGPAQFIPATWDMLKNRIAQAVGVSVPNPWNPEHAFAASALYLQDRGAAEGGYAAERRAACRYFSGSDCTQSAWVASYGDSVMRNAAAIQRDIDLIRGN